MIGTTLIYTKEKYNKENLLTKDFIQNDSFIIYKSFNNKFKNEKVFQESQDLVVVVDGVILNNNDLYKEYLAKNNFNLIEKMYEKKGINLVQDLRGNFYGIIYDKLNDELYIFTNHLGNKPLYYYFNKEKYTFIASSDLFDLIKALKELGIHATIDELGAYYMLTFGYMISDTTLIQDVKRVEPGTIINIKDNKLQANQYFFIENENLLNDSEEEIIYNMNELLKDSIDKAFKKDIENGYKHVAYLSGGLDSRMISIIAKKLGYNDITTITFAENYSRDEKIARKIAADFKFNSIFRSLNNGMFLKEIDKAVDGNFGQNIYSGAVHLVSTNNLIDFNDFGFIHNGNLADVMHGDYIDSPKHTEPSIENWMYSRRLKNKVEHIIPMVKEKYGNEERFAIYNRGINGMYNGSVSSLHISETCEPFTNQDLISYCSRMKPEHKYKEALFLKMIQKYYPEATNYKWQKWNLKPTKFNTKFMGTIFGKAFRVLDGQIQMLGSQSNNMNPFNKWYNENNELRSFINEYLSENIYLLEGYPELKKDCEILIKEGNVIEKTQVMTLLNFIKRIKEIYE
ncbi:MULTISPECIES: asparagine synthase-related protein [Clostridium]|uniref:asparagine synthase-related protein n=1 Tax=Clostridium TaxID=1485 RepID=UPI00115B84C0|nr:MULTISPECIES: asparagine synthase-related protein [Clostridium]MDB1934329.1 asparagine synthase-related protein [Clostridium tertium]MDB1935829.1 asparagine synthase-related protein [Clostridium tertium]MDB1969624.1 asparagine synthase-related protein [Clostridium tertium]MDU2681692.1 asparagine synthase-related protein [Clostridium sp.]MDY4604574.1 asparagine synthase-related protein [Clostridium tertium]